MNGASLLQKNEENMTLESIRAVKSISEPKDPVKPPTVVTNINREGLHGRIPRKVESPAASNQKNKQRSSQKMFKLIHGIFSRIYFLKFLLDQK